MLKNAYPFTLYQGLLLSALMSLAAVASCLYSPALPMMAQAVHKPIQALQFLVVANLIGHTVGPLLYGVLANRLGRVPTIRIGLLLTVLGALLCVQAGYKARYEVLWLGAVILTLGANVGVSLVLTMVKDQASSRQLLPSNALVLWSFALLPGLAVWLGSWLLTKWTWMVVFGWLIAYVAVLWLALPLLPETKPKVARLLSGQVLTQKNFWLASVMAACVTGCFYTFNAQIPRIALSLLHTPLLDFGWYSNWPSLGMLVGNAIAVFFAHRWPAQKILALGIGTALLMALAMMLYTLSFYPQAVVLFIFIALINVGLQIIFPAAVSVALSQADNSASATSFLAMIHTGCASVMVALGNLWPSTSYVSLPMMDLLLLLLAAYAWYRLKG